MKKEKTLGIVGGIIAAIIISVIFVQLFSFEENDDNTEPILVVVPPNASESDYKPAPRDWQISGPFEIDRKQYALGENIFLRVGALAPDENGQAAFLRTFNDTHYEVYFTIPFDASKPVFNQYFKPQVSKTTGICTKDYLIGNWTVVFQGTNYPNLKFEIIDLIVTGDEESYNKVVC